MDGLEHGSRRREDRHAPHVTFGCSATAVPTSSTEQHACRQSSDHRESGDFLKPFTWHQFLGLPHALAADPVDGEGADCLLLALRVLDEAGRPHPPADLNWFELAAQHRWNEIETIFHEFVEPVAEKEPYAITLLKNGPAGLGVGIVVDDGLLITHHRRGVIWIPPSALKPLQYYRVKA